MSHIAPGLWGVVMKSSTEPVAEESLQAKVLRTLRRQGYTVRDIKVIQVIDFTKYELTPFEHWRNRRVVHILSCIELIFDYTFLGRVVKLCRKRVQVERKFMPEYLSKFSYMLEVI